MQRLLSILFVSILLFGMSGCFSQRLHDVEGAVTIDGQPIVNGFIMFFGKEGKGTEGGARIVDGKYSGKAPAGTNRIRVQGFLKLDKPVPDPDFPGSMISTRKATDDALHWDNEKLFLEMNSGVRDIHLKSDPDNPVEK